MPCQNDSPSMPCQTPPHATYCTQAPAIMLPPLPCVVACPHFKMTWQGSYEKLLAYMLHRAGITFVEAFFDLDGKGTRTLNRPDWNATRDRQSSFAGILVTPL